MADSTYHFRTSMGGYHKGDVTAFIEKTAAKHRSELLEYEKLVTELQERNLSLEQQLNLLLRMPPAAKPAPDPVDVPEPEPAPVSAGESERLAELIEMELQACRRAEAAERNANIRARKMYLQMDGLCTDTMEEFQRTDAAVKGAVEAMLQQAASLEQAYQTLSAALAASREKLAEINEQIPEYEEAEAENV